jgi:hypothetical protein
MATVRYFYIDDDTAVLFGANGTALTTALVGATGIISDVQIELPVFPLWSYLVGLVSAFISKAVINLFNDDVRAREKAQAARDFLIDAMNEAPPSFRPQLEAQWAAITEQHSKLLTETAVTRLNMIRAVTYLISALCFLSGTASIISFVDITFAD